MSYSNQIIALVCNLVVLCSLLETTVVCTRWLLFEYWLYHYQFTGYCTIWKYIDILLSNMIFVLLLLAAAITNKFAYNVNDSHALLPVVSSSWKCGYKLAQDAKVPFTCSLRQLKYKVTYTYIKSLTVSLVVCISSIC